MKNTQHLKRDVEQITGLSVVLECEEADDCHFQEHLYQVSTLLILATQHSSITAWVMGDEDSNDDNDNNKDQSICFPATIDFSHNYQHGVKVFLNKVAKQRKLSQRRRREETKEEEDFGCSRIYETRYAQEETIEKLECSSRIVSADSEKRKDMATSTLCVGENTEVNEYVDDRTEVYDRLLQRLRALEVQTERKRKQPSRPKRTRTVLTA
mmetsp:Transcript_32607/g.79104  ORF Transcript_32607/g.79104 Transcript_32607/m.79104 type:complete len:211 (+) Transcript_32607:139-771(+)